MRTIQVPVFKFSELSPKAKQKAKYDYAALFGYESSEEALETMKKLAEHFGGRVKDYSIDWFGGSHSSMEFDMPDEASRFEIRRLLADLGSFDKKTLMGDGECKLTGWCYDEDAIEGFRKGFWDNVSDLDALMQRSFQSLLRACQADCESSYEDERFSEHCDVNEYEFLEDGSAYNAKKESIEVQS